MSPQGSSGETKLAHSSLAQSNSAHRSSTENGCADRHPLVQDGSSQAGRAANALHPNKARIDDRKITDWVSLVNSYAKDVQFFNSENQPQGDFSAFFEADSSQAVAQLANLDVEGFRRCFEEKTDELHELAAWDTVHGPKLAFLHELFLDRMAWVCELFRSSQEGSAFRRELERHIAGSLSDTLLEVVAVRRLAAQTFSFFDSQAILPAALWEACELAPSEWRSTSLIGPWRGVEAGALLSTVAASATQPEALLQEVARWEGASDVQVVQRLLDLLERPFDLLARALTQLSQGVADHLWESLRDPGHRPQMALFLAFLRLFRIAQRDINTLTGRHLDYYYNRLLKLTPLPAMPNQVPLVFQLAKHVKQETLEAGELFPAGDNPSGVPVFYQLTASVTLNGAKLAAPADLKSVFIDAEDGGRIYAADVAASSDGQGAEFDGPEGRWEGFGKSQRSGPTFLPPETRTMRTADVGFAIASPELSLSEGLRTVTLLANFEGNSAPQLPEGAIYCRFTTAEGWYTSELTAPREEEATTTLLRVVLPVGAPALTPYTKKTHGSSYPTSAPIMEVLVRASRPQQESAYTLLKTLRLTHLTLRVSADGMRALKVANDDGSANVAKPFLAFGSTPNLGSACYIGQDEAFRKQLTSLTLNWSWHAPPAKQLSDWYAAYSPAATESDGSSQATDPADESPEPATPFGDNASFLGSVALLRNGEWSEPLGTQMQLNGKWSEPHQTQMQLFGNETTDSVTRLVQVGNGANSSGSAEDRAWRSAAPELGAYATTSSWGYLRIRLTEKEDPFGHRRFPKLFADAALAPKRLTIPAAPWAPKIAELTLSYTASVTLALDEAGSADRFFHVHPFGFTEPAAEPSVTADSAETLSRGRTASNLRPLHLLPQFVTELEGQDAAPSEGELYLGLTDLRPPESLSLWVQVAEGSAEPEVSSPEVVWSYLTRTGWRRFQAAELTEDGTRGFTRSGRLLFQVPRAATKESSRLGVGRHWLRASLTRDSSGCCDLIAMHPQAAVAELVQPELHATLLRTPLAAESISSLKQKRATIKGVHQPYSATGGRPTEAPKQHRQRISERLRHKGRGISIWDYERIVLQHCPEVWKAKCISHSTYGYSEADQVIPQSEFAPGFVSLVVTPDLRNRNAVDPLEPRTSLAVRTRIHELLSQRISPFAAQRLQIVNPLYERLQLDFQVAFGAGLDWAAHHARLNNDIIDYLTPWAADAKAGAEISFGGRVHRSTLIHFVEKLTYVDHVSEFIMNLETDDDRRPVDVAVPSSARSIFTSSREHTIREMA